MPHSDASLIADVVQSRFARDVAVSLARTPRRIPSEYLYDALGSALFEAIGRLPWYPITRAECGLLRAHAGDILSAISPLGSIVELGPGNGAKLAVLASAITQLDPVAVHLVDVSASALAVATTALDAQHGLTIVPHRATYEAGLADAMAGRSPDSRAIVLFLGSNIGNFDEAEARAFLGRLRARQVAGDWLLLGADLVKPAEELVLAYNDPLGVTAAFNRNLLVRANRELDADFALDAFGHRAVWNPAFGRVEMHLVSTARQRVRIRASALDVIFEPEETIWTESSYKYDLKGIEAMLERAGFRPSMQWTESGFALTLAEAVR